MIARSRLFGLLIAVAIAPVSGAFAQVIHDHTAILRQLAPAAPTSTAEPRSIDLDIRFAVNSADLLPEASRQLDELAAALRSPRLSDAPILIAGHTDASGSASANRQLSERRAISVKIYLVERHRLDPRRFRVAGHGSDRLKLPFDPRNPVNRRVEIAVAVTEGGVGVARPVR